MGKGELLVFTRIDNNTRPALEPALTSLIKSLAPAQAFYAARNSLELSLRRDAKGRRYILTALNPNLQASVTDEVRLRLPVQKAIDVEIGLSLPLRRQGGEMALSLALSPGEGVVIEVRE